MRCDGQRLKKFSSNDLNFVNEVGKVRRTGGELLEDLEVQKKACNLFPGQWESRWNKEI